MKIVISSEALATKLNDIDFDISSIECLQYENNHLTLYVNDTTISIGCAASFDRSKIYNQDCVRWEFIKTLMNQVDEQPVVLDISEANISVIFNY